MGHLWDILENMQRRCPDDVIREMLVSFGAPAAHGVRPAAVVSASAS
jgi:hypothetical protein